MLSFQLRNLHCGNADVFDDGLQFALSVPGTEDATVGDIDISKADIEWTAFIFPVAQQAFAGMVRKN